MKIGIKNRSAFSGTRGIVYIVYNSTVVYITE